MCTDCGWIPGCKHCDAKPTCIASQILCGVITVIIASDQSSVCPECSGLNLFAVGHGTERLEEALADSFPDVPIIRVDRDTTARRRAFEQLIQPVIDGEPCILVGHTDARQGT
jgi:primosomal protein N' (replication factor Y)